MQDDGNLVLYSATWSVIWNTPTWGNEGDELTLRDDGTLAVLSSAGLVLWSSPPPA